MEAIVYIFSREIKAIVYIVSHGKSPKFLQFTPPLCVSLPHQPHTPGPVLTRANFPWVLKEPLENFLHKNILGNSLAHEKTG